MSIDRQHRDLLLAAIDRFLNDELTAFTFDDAIFDIRDRTDDDTVKQIIDELWCCYDDFEDHKVVLNQCSWNYIQRLRLLLHSDAELALSKKRIWSLTQVVAAVGIAGFIWAAYRMGWGQQLLVVAIPFGFLSIALSTWRNYLWHSGCRFDVSLTPFNSVSEILRTRRRVPQFRKQPYPTHLQSRRIRGVGGTIVNALHMYPRWLMFSPIVLMAQLLPVSINVHRVVLSRDAAIGFEDNVYRMLQ